MIEHQVVPDVINVAPTDKIEVIVMAQIIVLSRSYSSTIDQLSPWPTP